MLTIDLNCDMGESFGAYSIGNDEALMDYVSSVNVGCGFHGGDPTVMRKTVTLATKKKIAIGAHPGYPDLAGFGRREMKISPEEVYDLVLYQIGALQAFCRALGNTLRHVKPHGALYNTAAKDKALARAIAQAVRDIDKSLLFVGLSGSVMIEEASNIGLRTVSEVFADRTYQDDGMLTPRSSPNAMIQTPQRAADQILQMVRKQTILSVSGKEIPVVAQTVCIHGDSPSALSFAQAIVTHLKNNDVIIKAC